MDTTSPPAPRTRRLLAAALGLLIVLAGLGLGTTPAGAAPGVVKFVGWQGYDQPGPSGYHHITWGEPLGTSGGGITTWQVERWNSDKTEKLGTYNVPRASGPDLTVNGLLDGVVYWYRVRALNQDGYGSFNDFQGVQVHANLAHHEPFASESDLVKRQYQDFLGRQPSIGELSTATVTMTDAGDVAELIEDLATRPARGIQRYQIIRLYIAYFDRAPDAPGLAYWEAQMKGGRSLKSVSAFFAKSSEFKETYDDLSNAEFVALIYQNVLDRSSAGDPGAAFWTHELDTAKRTRGDVMVGFSESDEGRRLRRGDAVTSDLWLAMVKTPLSKANMAGYARHILGDGNPGTLGLHFLYLFAYNP